MGGPPGPVPERGKPPGWYFAKYMAEYGPTGLKTVAKAKKKAKPRPPIEDVPVTMIPSSSYGAVLYTDGSCMHVFDRGTGPVAGSRGWGGWAAIVECGHEGWVLRGSAADTTNVRMELTAIIEGFRSLPSGTRVLANIDCTTPVIVHHKWKSGIFKSARSSDRTYWVELVREFERLDVTFQLVRRRDQISGHKRAHAFAGHEARRAREAAMGWKQNGEGMRVQAIERTLGAQGYRIIDSDIGKSATGWQPFDENGFRTEMGKDEKAARAMRREAAKRRPSPEG